MININRNNYEKYFIDFLDGNLSQPETEELFLFLGANPDLKEELENFDGELVIEGEVLFENKSLLIKKSLLSEITSTNFDELCIASLENDLSVAEERYFNELIIEDQKKQKEFDLFKLTKIRADESVIFEQKNELKNITKPGFRWNYTAISIAASVILLIGLYFLLPKQNNKVYETPIAEIIDEPGMETKGEVQTAAHKEELEKITPVDIYLVNNKEISNAKLKTVLVKNTADERFTTKQDFEVEKLASLNINVNISSGSKPEGLAEVNTYDDKIGKESIDEEYFTIGSFLASTFNERVLNKKNKSKLEWFDVAQASVEGINKLTGSDMKLERKYDENGNPDKTEFNSKLIAFSAPAKKD